MLKLLIALALVLPVHENTDSLKQKAVQENKNIIIYFSGSDWCTICHQFKSRVINEPKVNELLKDRFVYYVADFPQRKKLATDIVKMNEYLASRLNEEGSFPRFVITDENFVLKAVVPNDADAATAYEILEKNIK
ncbi:MAG: thioredoxin family protein [Ferruginibacter sp.]